MGYIVLDTDKSYKSRRRERVFRIFSIFFSFVFLGLSLISFKVFKERRENFKTDFFSVTDEIETLNKEIRDLNKTMSSLKKRQINSRIEIEEKKEVIKAVNNVAPPITELINRLEILVKENNIIIEDFSFKEKSLYIYMNISNMKTEEILSVFEKEFSKVVLKEQTEKRTILKLEGVNEKKN